MKTNELTEEQIVREENEKHDLRLKNKVYPLDIFTEAKTFGASPYFKEMITEKLAQKKKVLHLLIDEIEKDIKYYRKTSKDRNQYLCYLAFYQFGFKNELLNKLNKEITYYKQLLSLIKGKYKRSGFTKEEALAIDIIRVCEYIDIHVRNAGRQFVSLCPLHEERTPSFYIYPETNSFYCFGCNQGGNGITLIRLLYKISFKDALTLLAKI